MKTTPRILITSGCILWCASFFGEALSAQPYSTLGIIVSPILTVLGVLFLLKNYYETRGHFPTLKTIWNNLCKISKKPIIGADFNASHMFRFWTFCIFLWMGFVLLMVLTIRRSEAFQAVKQYCKSNQEIILQTGDIKFYGVLVGGSITSVGQDGKADLDFTIVGTNGNFKANSLLTKQNGIWSVEKINLDE